MGVQVPVPYIMDNPATVSALADAHARAEVAEAAARARDRATSAPRFIITDKLAAYIDGIERVSGAETRHIQSKGMRTDTHNNIIERFHGTIKERTKVMRDFKSRESAKLIMSGWEVHYNFFRPHMSLKGKTPAEAAGIKYEVKNWNDAVKAVEE